MNKEPYYCPHCRGNRTKFKVIHRVANEVQKDAFDGNVLSMGDEQPYTTIQGDTEVECLVCHYTGFEAMFINAAKREPRKKNSHQGR